MEDGAEATNQWEQLGRLGREEPNILGKLLMSQMFLGCEAVHEQSVRARTEVNLTRAFVAIHLFRRDEGAWPESFAALRAKSFLSSDPVDLFAGKPVRYCREKSTLWSVGADEKDDGGDPKSDLVIPLSK